MKPFQCFIALVVLLQTIHIFIETKTMSKTTRLKITPLNAVMWIHGYKLESIEECKTK